MFERRKYLGVTWEKALAYELYFENSDWESDKCMNLARELRGKSPEHEAVADTFEVYGADIAVKRQQVIQKLKQRGNLFIIDPKI